MRTLASSTLPGAGPCEANHNAVLPPSPLDARPLTTFTSTPAASCCRTASKSRTRAAEWIGSKRVSTVPHGATFGSVIDSSRGSVRVIEWYLFAAAEWECSECDKGQCECRGFGNQR